jgi:hypothetical protein
MTLFKNPITTTINAMLLTAALVSVGALEVNAKKFDRGYLPPGRSAKIRPAFSTFIGSANGGIWKTTNLSGVAGPGRSLTVAGNGMSYRQNFIGRVNRPRGLVNGVYRELRNRQSFILPYIEQANLYR